MKLIYFVAVSLFSSFGDTLFLTGIPLYFYHSTGEIAPTTFVSVAISITVLLSRKLIIKNSEADSIKITAYGELLMAFVEILLLIIFFYSKNMYVLVAGTVPLAFIYNNYAPAKFYRLQEDFFGREDSFVTTLQSSAIRFGQILGISVSGYAVLNMGIEAILFIDIISFIIFGISLLLFYKKIKVTKVKKDKPIVEQAVGENTSSKRPSTGQFVLYIGILCITFEMLLGHFFRGTLIPVVSEDTGLTESYVSFLRASFEGVGILVGIIIAKKVQEKVSSIWGILTLFLIMLSYFAHNSVSVVSFLFIITGVISSLSLLFRKKIFENFGVNKSKIAASHWAYSSLVSLLILPIGLITDYVDSFSKLTTSMFLMCISGIIVSYFIYILLKRESYAVN